MGNLDDIRRNGKVRKPFIPAKLDDAGLTALQMRLVIRIARRGVCYESQQALAEEFGYTDRTIRTALKQLATMEIITQKTQSRHGHYSSYELNLNWFIEDSQTETHFRLNNNEKVLKRKSETPQTEMGFRFQNKGTPNKVSPNKYIEHEAIPPVRDHVFNYATELGLSREIAETFLDHYDSNGWKVGGKAPMKNWKAAFRNWKRRNNQTPKKHGRSNPSQNHTAGFFGGTEFERT